MRQGRQGSPGGLQMSVSIFSDALVIQLAGPIEQVIFSLITNHGHAHFHH
jgi:Asp-tRNA(Asn)/Glu-tRNA(Gln) amidotransferase A subunit family amidase